MPNLDNERSIRLTKREMLLIQDILKDVIEDLKQNPEFTNNDLAAEHTKRLKDIVFKLDKKLCSIKHE